MKKIMPISVLLILLFSINNNSNAAFPIKQDKNITISFGNKQVFNLTANLTDPDKKSKSRDKTSTAFILGLIGILSIPVGLACSILAIIYGSKELKAGGENNSHTGYILGIVGTAISGAYFLLFIALIVVPILFVR